MERDVQPPRGERPAGLPESPAFMAMKAASRRDEALAMFLEQLTELASIGTTVLQEMLAQVAEEKARDRQRRGGVN